MSEACRACDGRGKRVVPNKDNVFSQPQERVCGVCQGSRRATRPKLGTGRRFFPRKDPDDQDAAGDEFLRRHGYGRHGR